jgi:predicted heme/steroid binding protein
MGYTRNTGQLSYLITYDGSGNITVPASFTQTTVTSSMLKADSSGKLVAAVAGTDFVAPAGLSAYVPTTRTITINGTSYDLSADRSWSIVSGVSSFNTRTGAITLSSTDVNEALGYIPVTNARTLTINGTTYDLSANRSWSIVAGLSSFNTRTGAITLLDTDVTGALGYTPVTNARTITINGTTYDLSANRTWTVDASSVTTRVIQKFTATASQTAFTVTGGYTVGMVDVFLNGIKLDNAVDFTATDGSVVTLASGAAAGDIVEVYKYGGQFIANNTLRQTTAFTATAGQTTFTVSYSVGFVDVFYNGSKLAASEFTATNGTSIVLGTACVVNDIVEVVAYNYTVGAFTGVGGSGTVGTIAKWTASGTLNNSLIQDDGTSVGINTTPSSSYKLTVNGGTSIAARFIGGNEAIRLDTSSASYDASVRFYNNNSNTSWAIMQAGPAAVTGGGLNIYTTSTYPLTLGTNGTEAIRVFSSGNIYIGGGTPVDNSNKLEIRTSTYNRIATYFSGAYTSGFKFSDLYGGIVYDAAVDTMTLSAFRTFIFTTNNGTQRGKMTNYGSLLMNGHIYSTYTQYMQTPNGGAQTVRVLEDCFGRWLLVGKFAASAATSITGTWSSVRGLSTATSQSDTTAFSADFGDAFPTEVRVLGSTDFDNWRDARTIDFIYKVPAGRQWKTFFNGGATDGTTTVACPGGTRYGFTTSGTYDGLGRWYNPENTLIGMSDGAYTNPSTAYTTPTSNAFNWNTTQDAKLTAIHTGTYSGQDFTETVGFGVDDNVKGFFDSYATTTSNMQTGEVYSSAVWILIKLN